MPAGLFCTVLDELGVVVWLLVLGGWIARRLER